MTRNNDERDVFDLTAFKAKLGFGAFGAAAIFVGGSIVRAGTDEGFWGIGVGLICLIISYNITVWYKVSK